MHKTVVGIDGMGTVVWTIVRDQINNSSETRSVKSSRHVRVDVVDGIQGDRFKVNPDRVERIGSTVEMAGAVEEWKEEQEADCSHNGTNKTDEMMDTTKDWVDDSNHVKVVTAGHPVDGMTGTMATAIMRIGMVGKIGKDQLVRVITSTIRNEGVGTVTIAVMWI